MSEDSLVGVQSDDIVLDAEHSNHIHFFRQEAVVTEKLDGGNCSIHRGKVCHYKSMQIENASYITSHIHSWFSAFSFVRV